MANRCGVAVVGCGYVADFYVRNSASYPDIEIRGGFDISPERTKQFCRHFGIPAYSSLDAVLQDSSVELILNLTNPRSHVAVSEAGLRAGKHVYSEKPLAMTVAEAARLCELSRTLGLRLGCAPSGVLSDTAQTLWKAINDGAIGKVRLVYANYEDGMIAPNQSPWNWTVPSGAHWPARDEFEIGCTYEHSGYFLTWLGAFFGPAQRVHAFASCLIPEKGMAVDKMAPDFSVGCIEYESGVVARVTCGLVAPRDKSMTVIGDEGVLFVRYLRDETEPVYLRRDKLRRNASRIESRMNRFTERFRGELQRLPWPISDTLLYEKYPPARKSSFRAAARGKKVDFFRGPKEMLDAIRENRAQRLSPEFGVHVVELIDALQHPTGGAGSREIHSRFEAIEPLRWD